MPAPLDNLRTLDTAAMPPAEAWAADLTAFDDWAADLAQPFGDTPEFTAQADPEVDTRARLEGDRSHVRRPTRRLFVDYRPSAAAFDHLRRLPAKGESLHGVISGKYALWELVPALIARTKRKIRHLTIATLSFSKANAADLLGMLDTGHVKGVSMLISYYFKSTSRPIYDALIPELRERGQKVLAMRTHAKLLLARMVGGARFVCESSANLRSSVNVEQFVLTQCPRLYGFHERWIDGELLHGKELGDAQAKDG